MYTVTHGHPEKDMPDWTWSDRRYDSLSAPLCDFAGCGGITIWLWPGDQERLQAVAADRKTPQHHAWRARIVLMTADGAGTMAIRAATGKSKPAIWRWQERYMHTALMACFGMRRAADVRAAPARAGRRGDRTHAARERAQRHALDAARHGEGQRLAPSTIHQIWREPGLKPHRVETFKLSNDARFVEKVRDIVGLYLNPPERALVLSVDEKTRSRRSTAPSRDCP